MRVGNINRPCSENMYYNSLSRVREFILQSRNTKRLTTRLPRRCGEPPRWRRGTSRRYSSEQPCLGRKNQNQSKSSIK